MHGKFAYLLMTLLLIGSLFIATGCEEPVDEEVDDAPELDTVKIGILTDQSGVLASYGEQQTRGLELGFEYATDGTMEVLGGDIELIFEDDGSDPSMGLTAARRLIEEEEVDILQGSPNTAVALAVMEEVAAYEVPFIVDPAAGDSITGENWNRYTFRTGSSTSQDAAAGAMYAVEYLAEELDKDPSELVFANLAPDYAWGYESADAWRYQIEETGAEVLDDVLPPHDEVDFAPYLTTVLEKEPHGLVVSWSGDGAVRLFDQIDDFGLYEDMLVTGGVGDMHSLRAMGDDAVGFTGMMKYNPRLPENEVNDWFWDRHLEEYDEDPDLFTSGGFAAASAIVTAIEKAESTDTEALIETMRGMSFETPKDVMTFREEDHQALQEMYIVELVEDEDVDYPVPELIETISPEDSAPPVMVPEDAER